MKKLLLFIIIIFLGCKSNSNTTSIKKDVTKEKQSSISNTINVSGVKLSDIELTFETADITKPVIIVDENGNTQQFQNIKTATLKKKNEQKKDSVVKNNFTTQEKETDNSEIDTHKESISEAKNVKGIFFYIALIVGCLFLVFLIIRFKIKAKKVTEI